MEMNFWLLQQKKSFSLTTFSPQVRYHGQYLTDPITHIN